jgi:hypothetical protein
MVQIFCIKLAFNSIKEYTYLPLSEIKIPVGGFKRYPQVLQTGKKVWGGGQFWFPFYYGY